MLVVERHLIGDLEEIFSPISVLKMPDELVTKITAEAPETQSMRRQLEYKQKRLQEGMETCRKALQGIKCMF
jgi:hypothetical protein